MEPLPLRSSFQMRVAFCGALAVLLVLGAACSGDDDQAAPARTTAASTTTTDPEEVERGPEGVQVEVLSSGVVGVAGNEPLPKETTDDVLHIVELYVQRAMVDPMVQAKPAEQLDTLFSDASLQAVRGADRALLVDEGLPRIEAGPEARAKVRLLGFRGPGGTVDIVGAKVRIRVTGTTADGRKVQVVRAGDLSLVPQGHWRIESYELDVERQVEAA